MNWTSSAAVATAAVTAAWLAGAPASHAVDDPAEWRRILDPLLGAADG